ncbi:MAG: hypothetical protein WDM79_19455 [Terricaulis sp.]
MIPIITFVAGDSVTSALSDLINMPAKTLVLDASRLEEAAGVGGRDEIPPAAELDRRQRLSGGERDRSSLYVSARPAR